jgi:hypothetical protein
MKVGDRVKLSEVGRYSFFPDNPERHGTIIKESSKPKAVRVLWDGRKSDQLVPIISIVPVFIKDVQE